MRNKAWLALVLLLSGCGGGAGPVKRVTVGGHVFDVPKANLVEDRLPFLPEGKSEQLYVVLDPAADPAREVSVIVGTMASMCSFQTPPVVDQVPQACAVARGAAPQPTPGRLTKAPRFPGSTKEWDYTGEDGHVAVSCSGEPGRPGLCNATYAWRDLVWDASFDETQVARLEEVRAEIARKLDEWSARKG